MKYIFRLFTVYIFLAGIQEPKAAHAQMLHDTASLRIIEKCVDDIYSFRFQSAREKCSILDSKYPGHPAIYLLHGMIKYWEDYPLLPKSTGIKSYIEDMHTSIRLSEKKSDEAEFLLINLCARGLLLLFYSDNEYSSEVFPLALSTYPRIRQSFNYTSVYIDFKE
jgi:hypothetical protein